MKEVLVLSSFLQQKSIHKKQKASNNQFSSYIALMHAFFKSNYSTFFGLIFQADRLFARLKTVNKITCRANVMTTHAGDPECHQELAPAELLPAAGAEGDQHHQEPASTMPPPIPVVVSCVQTGSADLLLNGGSSSEEILLACSSTSSSASTQLEVGGAFPVLPTVSVESEEPQNLSLTWYAPTCASDFTLEWVQFVMKEFLRENNQDIDSQKQAENIQQFQVNMAGSPEDGATKKG